MKKIQLAWVAVIMVIVALVAATFFALREQSWNGPEKGVVLEFTSPRLAGSGGSPDPACGIINCHGLDIICGSGVPDVCTMEYRAGDNCRQYAGCGIIDGQCRQITSPEFMICKLCVAKCVKDFTDDSAAMFECENKCSQIDSDEIADRDVVEISHRRSIIESLYPKFKDFENNKSFAGTRVKAVIDGSDYYFAYITQGSGVPIVAATCFKVDFEYRLYFIGELKDSGIAGDETYTDVDPVECIGVK